MTKIGQLAIEPSGDTEIIATRAFNAPRRLVWDCHTQPSLLKRWMLGPPGWDMPVCEIDLKPKGKFRYLWRSPDGRELGQSGWFEEVSPHGRIVHHEKFDGDEFGGEYAKITTRFEEASGKTTMTMTMHFPSRDVRDMALKSGMETGMEAGYERLEKILAEQAKAA